jgi:hypothetical protein
MIEELVDINKDNFDELCDDYHALKESIAISNMGIITNEMPQIVLKNDKL